MNDSEEIGNVEGAEAEAVRMCKLKVKVAMCVDVVGSGRWQAAERLFFTHPIVPNPDDL
jgi:hypothetical protein